MTQFPFTCPTCGQPLTDDAYARLHAPEGVTIQMELSHAVAMQNEIADLNRKVADLTFGGPIIDHED